jgi:multidrug efflux pump subunit AcrA (membrane-fusion protein)
MEQYQKLASTRAVAQLQIKQKEQAYKAALARLAKAKITLNPTAAPVAIATERIAQERARGESTLATLNKERESLLQRQIEVQNQISRDHKELKQVETQLKKTVLRTPETGTILKLELRNPSQVVHSGESIAQIAPSNAPVVVKARVAAQDIAQIKICKEKNILDCIEGKVQLRISAYPYPDYGTLNGAVRAITADAITPQNNQPTASATPYYEVTIEPERLYLQKTNQFYPIQAGMEVTADIISREETLLTFILRKARLLADL